MRKEKAFTLIELLVVIAIIALLVSILVPSLTRARDMAKKALCSTTISNHGKSMAMYVSAYDAYPILSPWPWMTPKLRLLSEGQPTGEVLGWPTFYGLLEMNDLRGSVRTTWGMWYYGAPVDQIWDGCLCPAMDAPSIWMAQDNAASLDGEPSYGGSPLTMMSYHQWAVGYQFNHYLRSAVPIGRYPNRPGPLAQGEENVSTWCYQWIMGHLNLRNGESYYIQAVNDEELGQAAQVAQAWDGWDLESLPAVNWMTETQSRGSMTPGWHSGPPSWGTKVIFNAYRHKGCPNILYSDGHVSSDANMVFDPEEEELVDYDPTYAGLQATTYSHFNEMLWGNVDRVIPMAELLD